MKNLKIWAGLVLPMFFSSCATLTTPWYASRIDNLDIPLQILQKQVVATLPLGLRTNSVNGREFYSKYYIPSKKGNMAAANSRNRYSAHFIILGDRRPYNIEISVIKEERDDDNSGYYETGHEERLAKELETSLRTRLTKRREELNIIDDFRAF